MIESLYIIDQNSGIPLFCHELMEKEGSETVDQDLFSGFLKVLDDFSKETRRQSINEIVLASSRIIYEPTSIADRNLLFISLDDLKEKPKSIRKTLNKIVDEFEKDHSKDVETFTGKISVFDSFKEKVQRIITLAYGPLKEKIKIRWDEHPMKSLVSCFSMDKIKEMQDSSMEKIKEMHDTSVKKIKKFHKNSMSRMSRWKKKVDSMKKSHIKKAKKYLVKFFTPNKAYVIEDYVEEYYDDPID